MPSHSILNRRISPVIGINVDIGNVSELANTIIKIAKSRMGNAYVCVANVHMLTIARGSRLFGETLKNATLVVPDGMPLVWTQRLKGNQNAERVCGPDLMLELCQLASADNLSIYLLGGSVSTLQLLSTKLSTLFPRLKIAGSHSPEMLPEQPMLDMDLVQKINDSGASMLFVGLGCPKQEYWCATHAPSLLPISIGVGAAFDFHAGTKKRPPLFIQRCGLEWLYRLLSEPRRLWKRYLTSNVAFIYYSALDLIKRS